jgi:hypothetical protein
MHSRKAADESKRGDAEDGMSATLLRFQHRFASGAACAIAVDIESVRKCAFLPRFHWSGTKFAPREHIAWLCEVFAEVSDRACDILTFAALGENGRWQLWLCLPGAEPKRVKWAPKVFLIVPPWQEEVARRGQFVLHFGKYRGRCLKDVDPAYLIWVLRNFKNLWPETRNAIERYLATLH